MTGVDWIPMAASLAAGAALGGAYLAGLWWTVRAMVRSTRPGLLLAASSGLRMGLLLAGLWVISGGDWRRLAAALVGFALVRAVAVRRARPAAGEGGA